MTMQPSPYTRLEQSLERARKDVDRLKSRIRHINNHDDRHLVDLFIANAENVIPKSIEEAGAELSDHVLGLRTNLRNLTFQDRHDDDDADDPISRINAAIGMLSLSLDAVLTSAKDAGIVPSRPDLPAGSELPVPHDAVAERLETLNDRLDEISAALRDQVEPERVGADAREQAILNVVVKEMKTEVNLAKLVISGSMIDLTALTRAIEAISTLANSFVETARALGTLVRHNLVQVAERLRKPVKKAVANVKGIFVRAQKRILSPKPTAPPLDFDMDKVQAMILAGERVPPDWVPWVTELSLIGEKDFRDSAPLAGLVNLQTLFLDGTGIIDTAPLAGLVNLQTLSLSGTDIKDATPLASLVKLQDLGLAETSIIDASPLAGLVNLQTLFLEKTGIRDATPLAGLVNLKTLELHYTDITDVTPLAGLVNLKTLELHSTGVMDITPLKRMVNLELLILSHTNISDAAPLVELINLKRLYIYDTGITDATPLANLVNLEMLDLENTKIEDITPLAGLINLKGLHLSHTGVTDATPLAGLGNLEWLTLRETPVIDISPLSSLPRLAQIMFESEARAKALLPQLGAGWRVENRAGVSWYQLRRDVPGVEGND